MSPRTAGFARAAILALLLPTTALLVGPPRPATAGTACCAKAWQYATQVCGPEGTQPTNFFCRDNIYTADPCDCLANWTCGGGSFRYFNGFSACG